MMNLVDYIKTTAYFSRKISHANLFAWLALGPFLIILSLTLPLIKFSVEPLLFLFMLFLSFLVCMKWGAKGFILSLLFFLTYYLFGPTEVMKEIKPWHHLFNFSLIAGFFVTALVSTEAKEFLLQLWEHKEKNILDLSQYKDSFERYKKEQEAHQAYLESNLSIVKKNLSEREDSSISLKDLIQISERESCQLREENQRLAQRLEEKMQEAADLKVHRESAQEIEVKEPRQEVMDNLNQTRVENYQLRMLVESYQEQLEKYKKMDAEKNRLLFEKHKEKIPSAQLDFLESGGVEGDLNEYLHLKHEMLRLKSSHDQTLAEYEELQKAYQDTLIELHLKEFDQDLYEGYEELKIKLEEKNLALQNVRKELFKMENEYIALQKQRYEDSLEASSTETILFDYLSFTDQECLRLESENSQLRQIIDVLSRS